MSRKLMKNGIVAAIQGSALGLLLVSSPGLGQESTAPQAPEPATAPEETLAGADPEDGGESAVETITITADRREKSIQRYAGSASAFTQADLTRLGVDSVKTLSNAMPSVQVGVQEGNVEVHIRGIGSDNNTELGDPAAATHLDGVYIPRPRGVGSMFFDLERVEVNRGPQGTLRGRNATAGSLNIITAEPKLERFEGEVGAQVGNYSQWVGKAMINTPITDQLALRFAAFAEKRDPFYKNGGAAKDLTPTEDADVLAYRVSAKYLPFERLLIKVSHDLTREKGAGYAGSNFTAALKAGLRPEDVPDWRSVIYRGDQASQDLRHWGVRGTVNVDLGPVQLEYLGSYRDLIYRQSSGGQAGVFFHGMDPPELDNYSNATWRTTSRSQVHELRLYAPADARLKWTTGVFFFNEAQEAFLGSVSDQSGWYVGGEFNMPHVQGSSTAGYADAIFEVTKRWRLTAGVRATQESKSRTGIAAAYNFPIQSGAPLIRLGTEGFAWAADSRQSYDTTQDPREFLLAGVQRFGARDTLVASFESQGVKSDQANLMAQNGRYSDSFIDGRVGVDYDLGPGMMVYVSGMTGHKSGGFNDNVKADIAPTYRPESVYAVEVGSKNELLGKKLRVNVALFDYEYRDQVFQNIVAVEDPHDPKAFPFAVAMRVNAARSRVLGAELEGLYRLPLGFLISAQALLLDARFGESKVREARIDWSLNETVSLEGNHLPQAPRLTVNYAIGQSLSTSIGTFDWSVAAQTKTKYFMTIFNGEGKDTHGVPNPNLVDVEPGYTRLDVNLGHTRPDGKVRIDAFVTNLTDVTYMTSFLNNPGLNLRFFNPPRQLGVRAEVLW